MQRLRAVIVGPRIRGIGQIAVIGRLGAGSATACLRHFPKIASISDPCNAIDLLAQGREKDALGQTGY